MKLERDRGSILKNGSRIGYLIISVKFHREHYVDRLLLTPTKDGVFQDMRNPRCIWRVRLEPNGENIVLVVSRKMEILGAGTVML